MFNLTITISRSKSKNEQIILINKNINILHLKTFVKFRLVVYIDSTFLFLLLNRSLSEE